MTDPFLADCAAALPLGVLELIYTKVLQRAVLEHPYITEDIRTIHKETILKRIQSSLFSRLCDEYYFLGTGIVIHTSYCIHDREKIEIIRMESRTVYLWIPMNPLYSKVFTVFVQWEPVYWSRVEETGILLENKKRMELAKAIVLLHRVYPNLLTRNTPIQFGCFVFKQTTPPVSLYDLFHPKADKGSNLLPLKCLSRCSVM